MSVASCVEYASRLCCGSVCAHLCTREAVCVYLCIYMPISTYVVYIYICTCFVCVCASLCIREDSICVYVSPCVHLCAYVCMPLSMQCVRVGACVCIYTQKCTSRNTSARLLVFRFAPPPHQTSDSLGVQTTQGVVGSVEEASQKVAAEVGKGTSFAVVS